MTFACPLAFLLLIPWAFAAWRMLRKGTKSGVRFSVVSRLPPKTAGWRARVAAGVPYLFLIGAAALVVASARPRQSLARGDKNVDAIAISMTVDVSGTMDAIDLSPKNARSESELKTRLDVVKETFEQFVNARTDDLIGLVTFGGYAYARTPLTADHDALLHTLKGVQVPSVRTDEQGKAADADETMTAIGDGLAIALRQVKDAEVKSKIVILLSDGMSNTGAVTPDQAAESAAKLGIRVYTIGVGTNSRKTPFLIRDLFGRKTIQYANTEFDEKQLASIARKTNAKYFAVNDREALKSALEEIDQLEKTTLDRTVYERYDEFFPPFLLIGVVLVVLAVSLQMSATRRLV